MNAPIRQVNAGPLATPGMPGVQYVEDFYIYELDAAAIAPAGVVNTSVIIDASSDFKLVKLAMMADIAAAAQTESSRVIPLVTMQITDGGSGRNLFSTPVPLGALFGSAGLPFILPVPRIFRMRSSILVNLTNYDAAVTYNLRLALIGAKLFQMGK